MRLNRVEKTIIAMTDLCNYQLYKCPLHKVYAVLKSLDNKNCPYCGRESPNITEQVAPLQKTFREELGYY